MMRCLIIALLVHAGLLAALGLWRITIEVVTNTDLGDRLTWGDGGGDGSGGPVADGGGGGPELPPIGVQPVEPPLGIQRLAQPVTTAAQGPQVFVVSADPGAEGTRVLTPIGTGWGAGSPSGKPMLEWKPGQISGVGGVTGIGGPGGPGGFGNRTDIVETTPDDIIDGPTKPSREAVLRGLRWLAKNQRPDGSWDCDRSRAAGTALAVLAFLGYGQTTMSKEFGQNVHDGLKYLVENVGPNGVVKDRNMYAQGAVTLALAEGYALTGSPMLKEPLQRAVEAAVKAQQAGKAKTADVGGWRYSTTATDSDVSVSGWLIMGLKSAKLAGMEVPEESFKKAAQYLWNMYADEGGFGYTGPKRTPSMTGVGVLCQQFLGNGHDPRVVKSLNYLKQQPKPDWQSATNNHALYAWYYITQAMFQAGGAHWEHWNQPMRDTVIKAQQPDGRWDPPPKSRSEQAFSKSPVYSTALSCLILEVYYRYLPLYRNPPKPAQVATRQ